MLGHHRTPMPLDFGNSRLQIEHLAEIFRVTPLCEVAK